MRKKLLLAAIALSGAAAACATGTTQTGDDLLIEEDGGGKTSSGDNPASGGTLDTDAGSASPSQTKDKDGGAAPSGPLDAAAKGAPDASGKTTIDSGGGSGGGTDASTSDAGTVDSGATLDASDASCTTSTVNLLGNAGFDVGVAPWVQNPSDIVSMAGTLPATPQSPSYGAWLGGAYDANDVLYQPVTIPATTTSLHLKGYRWIVTQDVAGYDILSIQTRDSGGTKLEELDSISLDYTAPDTNWTAFDYVVPLHAGQTIQIAFIGTTDDSLNTSFMLDTLELDATYCK